MTDTPFAPFPPPPGLTMVSAADAGMCVDGVCTVPEETQPESLASDDDASV